MSLKESYKKFKRNLIFGTIFVLSVLFIYPNSADASEPKKLIKDGVLDANLVSFDNKSSVPLKGKWFFYWNEWVPPDSFSKHIPKNFSLINVRSKWNNFKNPKTGKAVGPFGKATYALRVKGVSRGDSLSLYIRSLASSYKLFIVKDDGVSLWENIGAPGVKKKLSIPWWKPVVFDLGTFDSDFTIVIHLSNFHYSKGGMWNTPELGLTKKIRGDFQWRLMRDFFVMGILLIMAFYHMVLFSLRVNDKSNLWFGLFCLSMFVRAFSSDVYPFYFVGRPSLSVFSWSVTFEHVSLYCLFVTIFGLLKSNYPRNFGKKLSILYYGLNFVMIIIILIAEPVLIGEVLFVNNIFVLIFGSFIIFKLISLAIRGEEDAFSYLGVIGLLLGVGLYDILVTNYVLPKPYILPYGLVVAIFIQSYIIAKKSAKAYKTAEKLGKDLEKEVLKKTDQIENQYKDFKTLLFNLEQGFLVFDRNGVVKGESTKITKDLFQIDPKDKKMDEIFRLEGKAKESFDSWLSHLFRGLIPFKDLLGLAPKEFNKIKGKVISLHFRPIYEEGSTKKIERVVCIATDITAQKEVEERSELERDKVIMINSLLARPLEFLDLMTESQESFEELARDSYLKGPESLFRAVHTLKARFASFKISEVVKRIHSLESTLDEYKKNDHWDEVMARSISSSINDIDFQFKKFLKENRKLVEVANNAINSSEGAEDLQKAKNELLSFYSSISKNLILKNVGDAFRQFIEPTKELARNQDKLVNISIEETNIHINPEKYKTFFSGLLHVFRNAVDHGIESREVREEKGKEVEASINISFKEEGISRFSIRIKDDGGGIDPDKIREKVLSLPEFKERPISRSDDKEIIQCIFEPGFSTRDEVSEVSGRGVGMDVVKKEAKKIDGVIKVESTLGKGTTFKIELPILK